MRKRRVKGVGCSYYHVISRVIEQRFYLGEDEKNVFRDIMWRVAAFSGMTVITYAVMDNHFHLLIQVPVREDIGEAELLRRLALIYKDRDWDRVYGEYERIRDSGSASWMKEWMRGYTYRMYDLSEFMKTLKLRYTIWYNKNHAGRKGTLWSDRFRSVLVEPLRNTSGRAALAMIATYIELNAVRAGIVEKPGDYTWCGYRDALTGHSGARKGILTLFGGKNILWRRYLRIYRGWWLRSIKTAKAQEKELLKARVRGFSYGVFVGCQVFVEKMAADRISAYKARYPIALNAGESISENNIYSLHFRK